MNHTHPSDNVYIGKIRRKPTNSYSQPRQISLQRVICGKLHASIHAKFRYLCSDDFSPRKTQATGSVASHFVTMVRNPNENNAVFACATKSITGHSQKKHQHHSQTAGRISTIYLSFCSSQHVLSKEHIVNCTDC